MLPPPPGSSFQGFHPHATPTGITSSAPPPPSPNTVCAPTMGESGRKQAESLNPAETWSLQKTNAGLTDSGWVSRLLGSNLSPAALWVTLGTWVSLSAPRFHPDPTPPGVRGFWSSFQQTQPGLNPTALARAFPLSRNKNRRERGFCPLFRLSPKTQALGGRWGAGARRLEA